VGSLNIAFYSTTEIAAPGASGTAVLWALTKSRVRLGSRLCLIFAVNRTYPSARSMTALGRHATFPTTIVRIANERNPDAATA
jgi:hypothetical protein